MKTLRYLAFALCLCSATGCNVNDIAPKEHSAALAPMPLRVMPMGDSICDQGGYGGYQVLGAWRPALETLANQAGLSIDFVGMHTHNNCGTGTDCDNACYGGQRIDGLALGGLPYQAPGVDQSGTMTVVNGSQIVVGVGTHFSAAMVNYDLRPINSIYIYNILSVQDATHMTLRYVPPRDELSTPFFITGGNTAAWQASQVHPDVVLLMAGSNDIGQGYTVDVAEARMHQLLDFIYGYQPGVDVHIAKVISTCSGNQKSTLMSAWQARIDDIATVYHAAGYAIHVVDQNAALRCDNGDMMGDNIHPTVQGYAKMAQAWLDGLLAVYMPLGDMGAAPDLLSQPDLTPANDLTPTSDLIPTGDLLPAPGDMYPPNPTLTCELVWDPARAKWVEHCTGNILLPSGCSYSGASNSGLSVTAVLLLLLAALFVARRARR